MSAEQLPPDWRKVKFGDVVRDVKITTKDPAVDGLERVVGLDHLDSESLPLRRWDELADLPDGTSFTRTFKAGQVLFGKRRAYQRKVAVPDFDGICSGDILVFEPASPDLLSEFLPYLVQSDGFFDHALGTSAGSLSPRTKWQELAKYEFALPPLDEQKRIAALMASVDDQIRDLASASAAVRDLERALVMDCAAAATTKVGDVVSTGTQGVQVGPFGGSVSSKHFTTSGVPILKINNLTERGDLDLTERVFTSPEHAASLERYRVRAGDVLTAAQATIGRTSLATDAVAGALISQHLIRIRPDPAKCLPEYLSALFNSPIVLRQMNAAKTKTTRDGLNTSDVAGFDIPLPPLPNQVDVVARLSGCRALRDRLTERAEATRVLRSTVLSNEMCGGADVQ